MTRAGAVRLFLLLWAACFGLGFVAFLTLAPTGDGFTHGMNRITAFLGWHMGAGMLALAAALAGLGLDGGGLKRLSRLPVMIFLAEGAALALLILGAVIAA